MPELPRNFWTTVPRASARARVQVSDPSGSHEPTIRIRTWRCCCNQAAACFSMFLPATVSSRLFGPNWIGCLRKGGSEIVAASAWETVPEGWERVTLEACCRPEKGPEGVELGPSFVGSTACKADWVREHAVHPRVGHRSPANRTEVLNMTIFEYMLTKKPQPSLCWQKEQPAARAGLLRR
jgi:hypothetical protein